MHTRPAVPRKPDIGDSNAKQQDTNDAGGPPASARPKTPQVQQDTSQSSRQDGNQSDNGGIYEDESEDLDSNADSRTIYSSTASRSGSQAGSRQASALPTLTPRSSRVASARSHTTKSSVEAVHSSDTTGPAAFEAAWESQVYNPSRSSSKTSRPASAKKGPRVVGSSDDLIEEVPSSDDEEPVQPSRGAVQTPRQNSAQSPASTRGRSASLRRLGDDGETGASTTPRSREGRSASGTRPSVEEGSTASSRARSRVREPSSSRPASETNAQEGLLEQIAANKARKDKTFQNGFGREPSDASAFEQVSPRHTRSSQVSSAGIASHTSEVDDNKTARSKTPEKTKRFSKEKRDRAHQRLEDMGFENRGNKTSKLPPMDNPKKQAAGSVSQKADDSDYDSEDSSPEAMNKMMKEAMNQPHVQKPKRPTDTDNFSLPAPQANQSDPFSRHARQSNLAGKGIFTGRYTP